MCSDFKAKRSKASTSCGSVAAAIPHKAEHLQYVCVGIFMPGREIGGGSWRATTRGLGATMLSVSPACPPGCVDGPPVSSACPPGCVDGPPVSSACPPGCVDAPPVSPACPPASVACPPASVVGPPASSDP